MSRAQQIITEEIRKGKEHIKKMRAAHLNLAEVGMSFNAEVGQLSTRFFEDFMSIVADAINGLESQLATAQAAVPNPALILQQDAAAAIVKWAAAQTPPVTVDPAIIALATPPTPVPNAGTPA